MNFGSIITLYYTYALRYSLLPFDAPCDALSSHAKIFQNSINFDKVMAILVIFSFFEVKNQDFARG